MGLGIPPLRIKIMLESNPLKSIMLVRRLAVVLGKSAKVLLGVSVDAVVALLALPSPMLALSVFRSCRCLL